MSAPSAEILPVETGAPQPTNPVVRPRSAWRSRLTQWDIKFTPYVLISPFFVLFGVFGLFPIAYNVWVSFQHYRLDEGPARYAGLENYKFLIHDDQFYKSLVNTFGLFFFSTVPQLITALMLAALLNRQLRFQTVLRMGVLLPYITPIAASTLVFTNLFSKNFGLVNSILNGVGVDGVDWKANTWSSWIAVITMVNWRWTGYWAIIFLAAMQAIPRDLYEAATIDGASPWTQFWRLTVPLLRPSVIFATIMSTIGGLQLFAEPLLFDDNPSNAYGGSDHQFQTISIYIYFQAWKKLNLGYSAALSVALFGIVIIISLINALVTNRIGRRK